MNVLTTEVRPGEWIIIDGWNPHDLSLVRVTLGEVVRGGYVDGDQVRVRCPALPVGLVRVRVNGTPVGEVVIVE